MKDLDALVQRRERELGNIGAGIGAPMRGGLNDVIQGDMNAMVRGNMAGG